MSISRRFAIFAAVALSASLSVGTPSVSAAWGEDTTEDAWSGLFSSAEDLYAELAAWLGIGSPGTDQEPPPPDEGPLDPPDPPEIPADPAPLPEANDSEIDPNETGPEDPEDRSAETPAPPPGPEIGYGMHVSGVRKTTDGPGDPPDLEYGQIWVGAWNLQYGWENVGRQLDWMAEHNVTPVIQVFYWGNDIGKDCLRDGCAGKTTAGWSRLLDGLGDQLDEHMGGREAIVVLEPEFNKGNVATYEPLDAALADKADQVHEDYPPARVALGIGGWAPQFWDTWDRAMEASDLMGLQLMRASTQDSRATYTNAAETLVSQAKELHDISGKPVFVTDIALATYPGQPYLDLQAQEIGEILERTDELREAHVEGLVYRALRDNPHATTQEYYGQAEVTWGVRYANGTDKPAAHVWKKGIQTDG